MPSPTQPMSTTPALTISYALSPPPGVDTSGLEASKTYTFAVSKGEGQNYYDGLRTAIAQAKDAFGEDLTLWKDRVGKAEEVREPKAKDEEEGDEEEEEEEV
ncbi:hypothetical protein D9611_005302 [Ephemerocybe angulata]|uniref:Uncharacterized protein n=1 Tax=Ephemerocybe angulata TaxID=980116 RepID=A0A8H5BZY8_9AGAR|nr:hypothetical protein D9611_005302 [Tulosesus angulatus]